MVATSRRSPLSMPLDLAHRRPAARVTGLVSGNDAGQHDGGGLPGGDDGRRRLRARKLPAVPAVDLYDVRRAAGDLVPAWRQRYRERSRGPDRDHDRLVSRRGDGHRAGHGPFTWLLAARTQRTALHDQPPREVTRGRRLG